ncbi:MAG: radical SAM protein [Nanohaloarchaea archaeon]|nr:radical SAM protein [Candidatus Nanohaloarchaea archaeon]
MLLVNLPYLEDIYSGLKNAVAIQPPLGLAYIAAYLENKGESAEILDANALGMSIDDAVKKAVRSKHSYIGITCTTNTIHLVYDFSKKVKEKCDKIIVVGGPHVTFSSEETLKECDEIDIIVRGEGELTSYEIVKGISLKKIKGITYRSKGKIISNPDRDKFEIDINNMPFPARHLLPLDRYRPGAFFNIGNSGKEYATIITSRGCPNKCVFCSSSHFWKTFRVRKPKNILSEIDLLVKEYGVKHLHFLDDTLTVPASRLEKICDGLIERDYDLEWNCYSRVDIITDDIVRKMKKAGCFGVTFGVESGNQKILNKIQKNITLNQIRKAVKITKMHDLDVHADFMIGLPGDTKKTIIQTIDFAIELNPKLALFSITTPFPGTQMFDEMKKKNRLGNIKWTEMTMHEFTKFGNSIVSSEEIKKLYNLAYKKFYFRPRFFMCSTKRLIMHPREIWPFILGGMYMVSQK